jgi:hypothetical protein
MANRTQQSVLFEDTFTKPVHVAFDAEALSSDGGLTLLSALDRGIGLSQDLIVALVDPRDGTRIDYTFEELFGQRCLGIAQAYADGNDAARLSGDPMLKLALGRDPITGADLASQSTISRFENTITARHAATMGRRFGAFVINRLARRHRKARVVTIDLDSTVDPTHGNQQLTLFNRFYDTWCYLPLVGFLSIDGDPEQYLFHARLRPGTSRDVRGVVPLLRRTVAELRRKFPKARIQVRTDAGFYHPMLLDVLEELKVVYAVAMPKNAALARIAAPLMTIARTLGERYGETQTLYGEGQYQARSWPCERRVVCKAEVLYYSGRSAKDNERFVVTNRTRMSPENIYAWYCGRGDSENRIKELKLDLAMDRTSCSRFVANQFRVLMTAAAYALFQELRWRLRKTEAGRWSVARLRDMLLKVAVRVTSSVRRVVCHLPAHLPCDDLWRCAAIACGAAPT